MAKSGFDVHFVNYRNLFPFLSKGRADCLLIERNVGRHKIKQSGLKHKIVELPNVVFSYTYCFFIGTKSPYLSILPDIGNTVRQMKKEGSIQEIIDKYVK